MNNYLSRAEIDEISEGLIRVFARQNPKRVIPSVDIESFITEFLKQKIEYAAFIEEDRGKIGFTADGETPLFVSCEGRIRPVVFPKDTIVLDRFLLAERETGRGRFTMAHEAAHLILNRMRRAPGAARFHSEYDQERVYGREELQQMFHFAEWQADAMAASLLMPAFLVEKEISRFTDTGSIRIYGDTTFAAGDKAALRKMADRLGVSYTALVIRLKHLGKLERHDICEYISRELGLGGAEG